MRRRRRPRADPIADGAGSAASGSASTSTHVKKRTPLRVLINLPAGWCCTWCYIRGVPTSRKRHMVTETDEVGAALERVREADPGGRVNLAELVVLGAERKVELIEQACSDDQHRAHLRERFLHRTRTGEGVEWQALLDVHERGWTHSASG